MSSSLKYLDRAIGQLRDLGLMPETRTKDDPIVALLNQISDLDEEKVVTIARTLNQASLFNEVVREQISAMELGSRYEEITDSFNGIREDAKSMVARLRHLQLLRESSGAALGWLGGQVVPLSRCPPELRDAPGDSQATARSCGRSAGRR